MLFHSVGLTTLASLSAAFVSPTAQDHTSSNPYQDRQIQAALEDRFSLDPIVHSNGIDVSVDNGIVELSGFVPTLLEKSRSTNLSELVRGVSVVVNYIQVRPTPSRTDADLIRDLRRSLLEDPATELQELDVSVTPGGAVTLSGSVDSWGERELAELVVASVRGVTAVQNQLQVRASGNRPDAEIQADINGLLRWSIYVDHELVRVRVVNGVVYLSGVVASAAEKKRAWLYALRSGATKVENELEVAHWARDASFRGKKYESITEESIAMAIERNLRLDPRIASSEISIEVRNGTASLSGIVRSLRAYRSANLLALETVGVNRVKNHLKVRPKSREDIQLAQAVRQALKRDPHVDRFELKVSARGGVIYLGGTVDSHLERAKAEEVADRVWGAIDVANTIIVKRETAVSFDPSMDSSELTTLSLYEGSGPRATHIRDEVIEANIEDLLRWSVYVNADRLAVVVVDGAATLSGTVGAPAEREVARRIAIAGGAAIVRDKLRIEPGTIEASYVR